MYDAEEARRMLAYRRDPTSNLHPFNLYNRYQAIRYYAEHLHEDILSRLYAQLTHKIMNHESDRQFDESFVCYLSYANDSHYNKVLDIMHIPHLTPYVRHANQTVNPDSSREYYTEPNDDMQKLKQVLFAEPTLYFLFKPLIQDLVDNGYILNSINIDTSSHSGFYVFFRIKIDLPPIDKKELNPFAPQT